MTGNARQEVEAGTLEPGLEIPPWSRMGDLAHWNRYAAVNEEFIPIHMDDEAGRAAGYDGAFGMGNLQWAYLHSMLRSWIGGPESGRILEVACQFRGPSLKGRTVTARGVVSEVVDDDGGRVVGLDVWTEDDDGRKMAVGTAKVSLRR